jgi:hypothetical protein
MMPAAASGTDQIDKVIDVRPRDRERPVHTGNGPHRPRGRQSRGTSEIVVVLRELGRVVGFVVRVIEGVLSDVERFLVLLKLLFAIPYGLLLADDAVIRRIEAATAIAERSSDDLALGLARLAMGCALAYRDSRADRERGLEVLGQVRDMCLHERFYSFVLPAIDAVTARERARRGDLDGAVPLLREAVDNLFHTRQFLYCVHTTGYLVETLLERGAGGDVAEAEAAIDRLAAAQVDEELVIREIWLLRLRALLAQTLGDESAYRDYRDRYRDMARTLGYEGHMAWAEAMP